ncbi:hypothetical protein [Hamadaea tsunoensis]|uniref:hypothetical protein n=1 Tax=Hamadaea tsunoensis TaxID=53368 RepID=UPI0003FEE4FA|nr:hypothetical protein [Hamadaea tsunoensis]
MSGQKRIPVAESSFFDIRRRAELLSDVRRNAPEYYTAINERVQEQLRLAVEEADARLAAADAAASRLSARTRELEERTTQELRRTAGADGERAAGVEQARAAATEALAAAPVADVEAVARDWIADAKTLGELIRTTLPHQRLQPGEVDRLTTRIAMAEANVEQGLHGPALSTAQAAYADLSDLRVRIEVADRDRLAARKAALRGLYLVAALVDEHKRQAVEASDAHGRTVSVTVDVDHWTRGQLSELEAEVAGLIERASDEQAPMPAADLTRIVQQEIGALEQRLSEVVQRSGLRVLASQLRANYADAVARSLQQRAGYVVVDRVYAGDDYREAYFAKLRHPDGSEIVVDVAATPDDSGACVVRLHSYDSRTTAEYVLRDRADAIARELRGAGILAEAPQTEADVANPAVRDLQALRHKASAAVPGEPAGQPVPPPPVQSPGR